MRRDLKFEWFGTREEWAATALPEVAVPFANLKGWVGARLSSYSYGEWTHPREREWFIYAVQGEHGGPIKIGKTTSIKSRISELQVGFPFGRLRLVGVTIDRDYLERQLHERLESLRMRGEWFAPHARVVELVRLFLDAGTAVRDEVA